jgi:hypothetical protein
MRIKVSNILLVGITLLLVGGCVAFCLAFLFPSYQERVQSLSPRTLLKERVRVTRFPPPFYQVNEYVVKQTVLLDNKSVWSFPRDRSKPGAITQGQGFHVSPDERYVVIEAWLHDKPMEVVSLGPDPTAVEVPVQKTQDPNDDHYYVYPFGFVRWNQDSRSFVVKVEGTCGREPGPGKLLAYRELWEIQPDTGEGKRISRQEQPWKEKLVWEEP